MNSQSNQPGVSTDSVGVNEAGGLSSLQSFLFESLRSPNQSINTNASAAYQPTSQLPASQPGPASPTSSENTTPQFLSSHRQNSRSTIRMRRAPSSVVDADVVGSNASVIRSSSPALSNGSHRSIHTPQVHHLDLSKPPPAPRVPPPSQQEQTVAVPRQLSPLRLSPQTPYTPHAYNYGGHAPSPLLVMGDDQRLTRKRRKNSNNSTPVNSSPIQSTPKGKYRLRALPVSPHVASPTPLSTEELKKATKKQLEKVLVLCIENTLPRTNPLFLDVYKKAYKRVRTLPACQQAWGTPAAETLLNDWAREATVGELQLIFPQLGRDALLQTMTLTTDTSSKRRRVQ